VPKELDLLNSAECVKRLHDIDVSNNAAILAKLYRLLMFWLTVPTGKRKFLSDNPVSNLPPHIFEVKKNNQRMIWSLVYIILRL